MTSPAITAISPVEVSEPTSAATPAVGVLAAARSAKAAEQRAAAEVLMAAVAWADLHPAASIDQAVCFAETAYTERPVPVAGPGAPLVAEFCLAEFAAAIGVRTEWGATLLGEAIELRHRLPRVWARVVGGDVAAWRAQRISRATIAAQLSVEAAAWVDGQVGVSDGLCKGSVLRKDHDDHQHVRCDG